jgi:Flp pilus assembly protein TadG
VTTVHTSKPNSKGRPRRRGAGLFELALALLPVLALVLSMIDFAYFIFMRSTFQHAVREGTRYAVTSQVMAGKGQDASIRATVQKYAAGMLNGDAGADKIRIRYFVPDTLVETTSNAGGNIVEVSIEDCQWTPLAPVLRATLPPVRFAVRSSDRMEPSPGGVPPAR